MQKKIFNGIKTSLENKSWYKKEGWIIKDHGFPYDEPEFQTIHIFKKNWFNQDKEGIHIESFLAHDPKKRKKSNVTIHLLHYPKIPNTTILRKDLAKEVVDSVLDRIRKRNGYKIRTGKYGLQPFSMDIDGSSKDFSVLLVNEISWLCQNIGPNIDSAISKLLEKQK